MAEFSLLEVNQALNIVCTEDSDTQFTGISTDSRTARMGELFIALQGENFDGHEFIDQAIERGARGVIISKEVLIATPVHIFRVDNTLTALQQLAEYHRNKFSIPIIAVTGSNGKTTTKDMIAAVLATSLCILKSQANFNNEIGLSTTLLQLNSSHQAAVVEMGMRARGEIALLSKIAKPTIGIITNVGETHIELLGSVDNIALAKGELAEAINDTGILILNYDDERVRQFYSRTNAKTYYFGLSSQADIYAENIAVSGRMTSFRCKSREQKFPDFDVNLPLVGQHNVYNALAAISVGMVLGLSAVAINTGLSNVSLTDMRQTILQYGEYVVINDAYNASPLSMAAALETLQRIATGRKIAVLGDMLELGAFATEAHHRIGLIAGQKEVDIIITVGRFAEQIAVAARKFGITVVVCSNHEQAINSLRELLIPGDTVLIKGSRGMKMETILSAFIDHREAF